MKRVLSIVLAFICVISVNLSISAAAKTIPDKDGIATTGVAMLGTPKLASLKSDAAGVVVNWNRVTGAVRYRVFRKEGTSSWKRVGDTTGLTLTDKTALSNHRYTYTVRCVTSDGKAFASAYDTVGKSILFIAAPVLKSAVNTYGGVTISWNASAGADRYRVFRRVSGGSWTKLVDTMLTSYVDKTAVSGTKYAYTVRCINKTATAYLSAFHSPGLVRTYVASPKVNNVTNSGLDITISWNRVVGASRYRVFYRNPGGSWKKLGDTSNSYYTYRHASSTSTEVYTVRCMNAARTIYTSGYDTVGYSFKLIVPTLGMKNALKTAQSYLKYSAFSYKGLYDQLIYEKYTAEEAQYGVDFCGADWYEQAVKCAASYLKYMSFSRQGLIEQLEYEGFTHAQAVYGVSQNGY